VIVHPLVTHRKEKPVATVAGHVHACPADVFSVLANGWYYSGWVVGTSHMRAVEKEWPAKGSRLFHVSGLWPAAVSDSTSVEEVVTNERLLMRARVWPFGEARIELLLEPEREGTRVTLKEVPVSGPAKWVFNTIFDAVLHWRNEECLARLAILSERPPSPGARQ
jgi:hypothetical protein